MTSRRLQRDTLEYRLLHVDAGQPCFKVLEFNPEDLGIEQRPKTGGSSSVSTWRRTHRQPKVLLRDEEWRIRAIFTLPGHGCSGC